MFFRIKKIKGREYCYIVQNKWKRKSSRQKVKGYLGRAYRLELKENIGFLDFLEIENLDDYLNNNEKSIIISDLIGWELYKHNVSKKEFSIDLSSAKLQKNKKNVALLLNDGFMCSLTLKNLLEFKPDGDEEADGYRLARCFVEAGIKVPQDVFIGLFSKLYREL